MGHPPQLFRETRIRCLHALRVLNNGLSFGKKAGHGEGHGNAMITMAAQPNPAQGTAAVNNQTIRGLHNLGAHRGEVVRDDGQAVGFFDP